MAKTFYTEVDIENLHAQGVTTLSISDDVVVTDLAREKALKLGVELVKGKQAHEAGPVRPYIAKQASPAASASSAPAPATNPSGGQELEQRVISAVQAKLGNSVDSKLLETIVKRVLQNVGK